MLYSEESSRRENINRKWENWNSSWNYIRRMQHVIRKARKRKSVGANNILVDLINYMSEEARKYSTGWRIRYKMTFARRFQDFCFYLNHQDNFGPKMLFNYLIISTYESYIKNITLDNEENSRIKILIATYLNEAILFQEKKGERCCSTV